MNAYKYNSTAHTVLTLAICKYFNVHHTEIYKLVKHMEKECVYINGKKYAVTLKEVE